MSPSSQDHRYYVAGGPVQPDRSCYVRRRADDELAARLRAGEYCHVIAPPHSGKTSLMACAAASLREAGVRVATVDLGQIGARGAAGDAGRWYYSLAYRIVRELRIRIELHGWWQDHRALTAAQRIRAFFGEVVLGQVEGPIVIFADRVETALYDESTRAVFAAVRACQDGRATDPELSRLTFCLLSAVPPRGFAPGTGESPFETSVRIELPDFDRDEVRRLADGLALEPALTAEVVDRTWAWTSGQPYLTQRIFKGLTRRSGRGVHAGDVDRLVDKLFLARNAVVEDQHLAAIGRLLLREPQRRAARLTLYGRIRKGTVVPVDDSDPVHRALLDSGLVVRDELGNLGVRNRVYREVFTARWANRNLPFDWRGVAVAVLAAAFVIAVPLWYTDYLPRHYVRVLMAPPGDVPAAAEAHRRLGMLPGHGRRADQLFLGYLSRQSRAASGYAEVQGIGERLLALPGGAELVPQLEAEFWDRRAEQLALRGDRDGALLARFEALRQPTGQRRTALLELLGEDYTHLLATLRTVRPLAGFGVDPESGWITTLDADHRLARWSVPSGGEVRRLDALEMRAEERVVLQQRALHTGPPRPRRLVLAVLVDHPRPEDVAVRLRSPSGRTATVTLSGPPNGVRPGEYLFDSRRIADLRALLDDPAPGSWVAAFFDRRGISSGALAEWSLSFDGVPSVIDGAGGAPIPIPGPQPVVDAESRLAPSGRRALIYPQSTDVAGELFVYDLDRGGRILAVPRGGDFMGADFAGAGELLLVYRLQGIELRGLPEGKPLGLIPWQPAGAAAPRLSPDGRYLLVDVAAEEGERAVSVWDLQRVRLVQRIATGRDGEAVAVGGGGRRIAIGDGDRLVRVWDLEEGRLLGEHAHAARPRAAWLSGDGRWLAVADASGTLSIWAVGSGTRPLALRHGGAWSVEFAADDASVLVMSAAGQLEVLELPSMAVRLSAVHGGRLTGEGLAGHLGPSPSRAVSIDGRRALKVWHVPPAPPVPPPRPTLASAAVDAEGRRLGIGSLGGDVLFQLVPPSGRIAEINREEPGFIGHAARVTALSFGAGGGLAASGALDGTVRVWEAAGGEPRPYFGRHGDGAVHDVLVTADGRQVISATASSLIALEAESGTLLGRHPVDAGHARLAPGIREGEVLLAGERGGLRRWSWRDNALDTLAAGEAPLTRVAASPQGDVMATATADGTVRLHEYPEGTPREASFRAAAPVTALAFAEPGTLLVAAGSWLHVAEVGPEGLAPARTRLLHAPIYALRVLPERREALLLLDLHDPVRRRLVSLTYTGSEGESAGALPTPAEREDLFRRLNLRLDALGEFRPLEP